MNEFRGGIIRMFEQGKSGYQIAQDMNLHARTVNRIIKRYQETSSKSTVAYSVTTENGHLIHPIWTWWLLNLEHLGGGSMLEAPPVDWSVEEELVKAWNAIPQDIIDKAVDDFPKRLKKCIEAGSGHFENK